MNLSTSNASLNLVQLIFLFFSFFVFVSGAGAQQDKIAILYLYAKDLTKEQLYTKEQLETHFLTETSPIKRFWTEQSSGRYSYEGRVFMVPIDRTEQELNDRVSVIKDIFRYSSMGRVLDLDYADYMKEKERKEKNGEKVTNYSSDDPRWKSISLAIPEYDPDNYTKTILLFGESGFGKLSLGRSNFSSKETGTKIKVNGKEYPSNIGYVDGYYFSTAPMEASRDLGLLHVDKTMLHEWGHTFGVTHAGYLLTDFEPMQGKFYNFGTDYDPTTYGNYFDIMGKGEYALHFNAYFKSLAGWISGSERREIRANTWNISLMPLEGTSGTRTVEIKCPGMFELPKMEFGGGKAVVPGKQPASLFIEYRSGFGFDKNLLEDRVIGRDLSVNTKGLLINLAFPDFNENTMKAEGTNFSLGSKTGETYKKNVWLLDMSPDNNRTNSDLDRAADNHDEASLVQGKTFYNDQLQVTIGNVRVEGGGVLFDVEMGEKSGVASGVYTSTVFSGQSVSGKGSPILYSPNLTWFLEIQSDGKLVIKNSSNKSVNWNGASAGITVNTSANKLSLDKGNLILSAVNDTKIWESNTAGFPNAKLVISNEGKLQVLDNNTVIWPKTEVPSPVGTVKDADGNTYKTVQIGNQTWMAENLRTTKCSDGTKISVLDIGATNQSPGMYWHDNNPQSANSIKYGPVYNWVAVSNSSCNVCPTGWHIPSQDEWNQVLRYWYGKNGVQSGASGLTHAAYHLRETGDIWPKNDKATNSTGFSARPGGWLWEGKFYYLGSRNAWWARKNQQPIMVKISNGDEGIWSALASTRDIMYARCIKD